MDGPSPPLSPDGFSAAVTAITSAFGDPTRRSVYLFAAEQPDGVTAGEVAERFALHPNVARHHLDKLSAGGYLEVRLARGRARAGRPSKRFVATDKQAAVDLPVRRLDLVTALLARALGSLGPEQAEALAEEVGVEYGRALATSMADGEARRSLSAALGAVAEALTAHGYAARAEKGRGGRLAIVSDHCPFGAASAGAPVICAVDRGMVRGMLAELYGDAQAEIAASRALGDTTCVTAVTCC